LCGAAVDGFVGRLIGVELGGEGIGAGIDASGALLVDTPSGTIALSSGEVHLVANVDGGR
jgi:hypothetical protein